MIKSQLWVIVDIHFTYEWLGNIVEVLNDRKPQIA